MMNPVPAQGYKVFQTMNRSMSFLSQPPTMTTHIFSQLRMQNSASWLPKPLYKLKFPHIRLKHLPLLCTKLSPWEPSLTYAPPSDSDGLIKGGSIFESINIQDTVEAPIPENGNRVIDTKNQVILLPQFHKWPMWLIGPAILLVTGMVPTLWLPLSSVFLGPNIAGLLSLVGLDCIFNMGATLFLLMADACARPTGTPGACNSKIPLSYRFWNMSANIVGFAIPLLTLLASYRGLLQPQLPFISFAVLLGPYLLLLSIQTLTEMLTWHWKSPVWLVTPVVYESYRVLQLMRGLRLGVEVGGPTWVVESIRVLVSWWVLILGIQLMRVAWFAGFASHAREQP